MDRKVIYNGSKQLGQEGTGMWLCRDKLDGPSSAHSGHHDSPIKSQQCEVEPRFFIAGRSNQHTLCLVKLQ